MAPIGETELDLRALWRTLRRRARVLVVLAAIAAVGTYVGLGFVNPLYTADTRILIEQRESPLTRPREQASEPAPDFDESAIQSQVEVLKSREIADAVIDKLKLMDRPEFDPATRPSVVRSLLVAIGVGSNPTDSTIRQRIMDSYFERLSVFPLLKSRVIGVEFSAPNPDLSAEVTNAVADAFVTIQQDAKRQSAVAATEWLQQEIERLRSRVADNEQAVADYRKNNGLFDVDQSGATAGSGGNLSTQQLGDINAELARARAARAEAEARADLVQKLLDEGGALDSSEEVLSSPLIQRLTERQVALRAQEAELSTTLLPGHPRIRAIEGQIANLDTQVRSETGKVLASLKTAARVAAAREESLLKSLNEAKADVSVSNDQGIELRALEREAAAQRDLLESFLARYREAVARTDADYLPADARIISRAVAPNEPSFPKKTMMTIAAALAVFLIGAAIVLLQEFLSGRAFRVIGEGFGGAGTGTLQPAVVRTEKEEPPPEPLAKREPAPPKPAKPEPEPQKLSKAEPEPAPKLATPEPPPLPPKPAEREPEPPREPSAKREPMPMPTLAVSEPEPPPPPAMRQPEPPPKPAKRKAAPPPKPAMREPEPAAKPAAPEPISQPVFAPTVAAPPVPVAPAPALPADLPRMADATDATDAAEPARTPEPVKGDRVSGPLTADNPDSADEGGHTGARELAEIIARSGVKLALFAGAEGGEGAGGVAFSAARQAAKEKVRCIVIDMGRKPSDVLGYDQPGLCELLSGAAAFGDVIQRDETARVHMIPYGSTELHPPMHRIPIVVAAVVHTYDRVILVADKLEDWPYEHLRPDVAAIVCGPETTDSSRAELYDTALARGAKSAVIVRYTGEPGQGGREESAAA